MIIQVIGLPCSGKTYYINKIKSKYSFIKSLDIVDFAPPERELKFTKEANSASSKDLLFLIESACGIEALDCKIIAISINAKTHKVNMQKRNCNYSIEEINSIEDQTIPANYTVYDYFAFENLIKNILSGADNAKRFFSDIRDSSI